MSSWSRLPPLSAPRPSTCDATTCRGRRFAVARVTASFRTTPSSPASARGRSPISSTSFQSVPDEDVVLVYGPGSSLVPHDLLWYADVPKRVSLDAVQRGAAGNLGQPPGEARLGAAAAVRRLADPRPTQAGARADRRPLRRRQRSRAAPLALRRRAALDVARSRRTTLPHASHVPPRPVGRSVAPSTPRHRDGRPEPRLVVRADHARERDPPRRRATIEVGFELLMALEEPTHPRSRRRGTLRRLVPDPLRLPRHARRRAPLAPVPSDARPTRARSSASTYTQDETYYVMETTPGAPSSSGCATTPTSTRSRADAESAEQGVPFDPDRYVQSQAAEQHRLYLIPAGTPHASGAGNVVLEISATPYLYTLRFYDWLRRDLDGRLRPVHVDHAFANVDPTRRGDAVAELMPEPRIARGRERLVGAPARPASGSLLRRAPSRLHRRGRRRHERTLPRPQPRRRRGGRDRDRAWRRAPAVVRRDDRRPGRCRPVPPPSHAGTGCKVVKAFVP